MTSLAWLTTDAASHPNLMRSPERLQKRLAMPIASFFARAKKPEIDSLTDLQPRELAANGAVVEGSRTNWARTPGITYSIVSICCMLLLGMMLGKSSINGVRYFLVIPNRRQGLEYTLLRVVHKRCL